MDMKVIDCQIAQQISNALGSPRITSAENILSNSCLAFGIHKGGSTMLHSFLRVYIEVAGKGHVCKRLDIPGLLFNELGFSDEMFDDLDVIPRFILTSSPQCFSGWRNIPISFLRYKPSLSCMNSVALIRDPRDCAVSAYYSFLKTHCLPSDKESPAGKLILEERLISQGMTIDEWVLQNIHRFTGELTRIAFYLNCNMRVYRYEDIWDHKHKFFRSVIQSLGLPHSDVAFENAFTRVNIKPGIDKRNHVRKGTPGDHREKLKPQTISEINEIIIDLLRFFNYY